MYSYYQASIAAFPLYRGLSLLGEYTECKEDNVETDNIINWLTKFQIQIIGLL